MAELKYTLVPHNHPAFLKKAGKRNGFAEAYEALGVEYAVAGAMLAASTRAGLTQEAIASRIGTSKSTVSRLESAGKHALSISTLKRYAEAVGCAVEIRLVPHRQ